MSDKANEAVRRVGRPRGPTPDPEVRRAELLDAAERVIRARGPDVGMDDIAAEIGLTKPAVYRSLGDKASLTAALAQRVTARLADQLAGALAATPADTTELRASVASTIDVFCRFVEKDANLYRFIVHGSIGLRHTGWTDKPLVVSLGEQIRISLAASMELAGGNPQVAATWAYGMIGAVFGATEHWLHHREITRDQLVTRLAALLSPALERVALDTGFMSR
jgi:AcrR family transcriptional regulator